MFWDFSTLWKTFFHTVENSPSMSIVSSSASRLWTSTGNFRSAANCSIRPNKARWAGAVSAE